MLYEEFEEKFYSALKKHLEANYPTDEYRSLLEIEPNNSFLKYLLGDCYYKTGYTEKANSLYKETVQSNSNIDFQPDYSNTGSVIILAFGSLLTKENPYINENFEKVLNSDLTWDNVYANVGAMYLGHNDISNAYRIAMKGFEKFANSKFIRNLLCTTLLKSRNISGAWGFFQEKINSLDNPTATYMEKPMYTLDSKNSTVYLYHSGSISDTLLYARYLEQLKNEGVRIILSPQNNLQQLFNINGYQVTTSEPNLENYSYRLPLMSLPYLFRSSLDTIPAKDGYLKIDESKQLYFNQKYFLTEKKKVGIIWSNTENSATSINLEEFIPLLENSEMKFYSFKEHLTSEEQEIIHKYNVINLGDEFHNYSDIASAIKNTDIMIGTDTPEMNLCGAIGHKSIALVPCVSDWRWGLWEEYTPWYNSILVLRQRYRGVWDEVVLRAKERIE